MSVIVIEGLTKRYGEAKGVFDLSFEVGQGEVFGYLGPNGAGKTTTIRHLLGFLNADSGRCSVAGLDCRSRAADIHGRLGYLPGEIAFFDEMKGTEYLRFLSELRGARSFPRAGELLDRFELDPSGGIKKMSKGMKQKLGLVAAFMHDPEILILDEPTGGLDPLMQNRFVELILSEKSRGKTILMSSHSFEEIEKTCDRVGIIREGRLAAMQRIQELKAARRRVFSVSFSHPGEAAAFAAEGLDVLFHSDTRVDVAVTGDLSRFTAALARHPVTGLDVLSQSLEEIFMTYYGGENHA